MLAERGKFDQLVNCGFKSVGEQMELTKLVGELCQGTTSTMVNGERKTKMTLAELTKMSENNTRYTILSNFKWLTKIIYFAHLL